LIGMPEMKGLQVLNLLSSHQIKSPIVLMSGADNEVLTKAEALAKLFDLCLIGVLNNPSTKVMSAPYWKRNSTNRGWGEARKRLPKMN
jgi:CheY-like chemotaxis protein